MDSSEVAPIIIFLLGLIAIYLIYRFLNGLHCHVGLRIWIGSAEKGRREKISKSRRNALSQRAKPEDQFSSDFRDGTQVDSTLRLEEFSAQDELMGGDDGKASSGPDENPPSETFSELPEWLRKSAAWLLGPRYTPENRPGGPDSSSVPFFCPLVPIRARRSRILPIPGRNTTEEQEWRPEHYYYLPDPRIMQAQYGPLGRVMLPTEGNAAPGEIPVGRWTCGYCGHGFNSADRLHLHVLFCRMQSGSP